MTDQASDETADDFGSVGRGAASVVAGQSISWIFAAITITVVPRFLGDVGVGQLAVAMAAWSVATIFLTFGSPQLLTRETARSVEHGNDLLSRSLPMNFIALLIVTPVLAAYAYLSGFDSTQVTVLAVVGVTTFLHTIEHILAAMLTGRGRIAITAAVQVVGKASSAIAVVAVVVFAERSVVLIAITGLVAAVVGMIVMAAVVARDPLLRISARRGGYMEVLRASWGFMLLGGVVVFYREIDVVTIAALADEAAVGWYAQTDRLFGTMLMVPAALGAALFPVLSRRWVEDEAATLDIVRRAASTVMVLVLPISVGCLVLGEEIAVTLFGEDFRNSGLVLQVYSIVLLPVSLTILMGTMCQVMGKERLWTMVMFVAAIATVPLDLFLVPWADRTLDNAAVAGAIAFVFTETGAVIVGLRKVVPGIIARASLPSLVKALFSGAVMGVVVWLLRDLPLPVPIAAGGVVYPTLVLLTGAISIDELSRLGGPFGRLARFTKKTADVSVGAPGAAAEPEEGTHES